MRGSRPVTVGRRTPAPCGCSTSRPFWTAFLHFAAMSSDSSGIGRSRTSCAGSMSGGLDVTLRRAAATALLALALLGAKATPGAAIMTVEEPVYIPAGVSDVGGTIGCVRTPDGGTEAVDQATGASLWRSAAPARALLIAAGRVFVLEERAGQPLRVAAYSAHEGRLIRAYDLRALDLPPWASLSGAVEGREWTVFDVAARLAGDRLE